MEEAKKDDKVGDAKKKKGDPQQVIYYMYFCTSKASKMRSLRHFAKKKRDPQQVIYI